MAEKWQKPVLVGGIGLSLGLGVWQSWQHTLGDLGGMSLGGAMVLYLGYRWLKRQPVSPPKIDRTPVNTEKVQQAIAATQNLIKQLQTEIPQSENSASSDRLPPKEIEEIIDLETKLSQLAPELARQEIFLLITGGKGVGKTTLRQVLPAIAPQNSTLTISETPPLFLPSDCEDLVLEDTLNYDLVLFLTAGDLTDSEMQTLTPLAHQQRTLLVFNKQDQYLPIIAAKLLAQLRQRIGDLLPPEAVLPISTAPRSIKVMQEQTTGASQTWLESPAPALTSLTAALQQILTQEREQLVCATVLRKVQALQRATRTKLHQVRHDLSRPIIEQYQWLAAAAAFANPVPALDLLATGAINTQLIIDLGQIYQQKVSLPQAENAVGILADLLIKLGLVEFSTQAIGHLLKSNVLTYVAGGAIQGISAAYLTKISGLSLIAYFQSTAEQETTPINRSKLRDILQQVYQENQLPVVQNLVQQATQRLFPQEPKLDPQP